MKIFKTLALVLALVMLMSGCDNAGQNPEDPSSSPKSGTAVNTGEALFTVGDRAIYEDEFKFWVIQSLSYQNIDPKGEIKWDEADSGGVTLREFITSEAMQMATIFKVIRDKAAELELTLTAEEQSQLDNLKEDYLSYFGDRAEMETYFADNGYTDELLRYHEETMMLFTKVQTESFGAGGEKIPDADVVAWAESMGILRAKHILFKTMSDDYEPYSDDKVQEALDNANAVYEELKDAEGDNLALEGLFDTRMLKLTEDPGGVQSPGGYQFFPGSMMESFEQTIIDMGDYGVSEPVDIYYGYSVIIRLPLAPDSDVIQNGYSVGTLRYCAMQEQMNKLVESWSDAAVIEYAPAWDSIDLAVLVK